MTCGAVSLTSTFVSPGRYPASDSTARTHVRPDLPSRDGGLNPDGAAVTLLSFGATLAKLYTPLSFVNW
jgi:hypothetical protein